MTTGYTAGRKVEYSANGKILRTISSSPQPQPPEMALVGAQRVNQPNPWEMEAQEVAGHYNEFSKSLFLDWQYTVKKAKSQGIREANTRMKAIRRLFKIGDFVVHNLDDQHLQDYAEIKALVVIKALRHWPATISVEEAAEIAAPYAEHHEFKEAKLLINYKMYSAALKKMIAEIDEDPRDHMDAHGSLPEYEKLLEKVERMKNQIKSFLLRLQDRDWWRRRLRRMQSQRIEKISRELHQVVITRNAYCSKIGQREWLRRQSINMDMLEHTLMENDDGEQYTLADLSETSTANPAVRRTELMIRIAGLEEYAKTLGYQGWMFTITCPSRYHAATKKTGAKNGKFKGASPKEAQEYLCKVWSRFRSYAKRITKYKHEELEFFGFRVAEPHHDGTPHWHILVFVNPDHVEDMKKSLRHFASDEDAHELTTDNKRNARFHYTKIKTGINPKTGKEYSAAGYIAKYIAKNIDGEYVDVDKYGQDAKLAAKAITAWASRNGIRQFQQVGGPSVTVWRELRRLARLPEEMWKEDDKPLRDFVMLIEAEAQESASHAWAMYCEYYAEHGLSLDKVMRTITATVQFLDDATNSDCVETYTRPAKNAYDEHGEKINGVIHGAIVVCSRWRTWTQVSATRDQAAAVREQRKTERQQRLADKAAAREAANDPGLDSGVGGYRGEAPTWTGVNNCTRWPSGQKTDIPIPQLLLNF